MREKFTCRACEKISQPPALFHATPRGWAGPNLLATIVFEKYGQHQPLSRQRDRYAGEGIDLSLSTLADQVGACTVALRPLHDLIAEQVLAAELTRFSTPTSASRYAWRPPSSCLVGRHESGNLSVREGGGTRVPPGSFQQPPPNPVSPGRCKASPQAR